MSTYLPLNNAKIVPISNSIGMAVYLNSATAYTVGTWPEQLAHQAALAGIKIEVINASHGGWTIEQLTNVARTEVDAIYSPAVPCVCIVHEGTNRLFLDAAITAQQAYQETFDYCYLRRSLGYHVLVLTTFDRAETPPAGQTSAQFRAKLTQYDNLIRTNWQLFADRMIDVRRHLPQITPGSAWMPDNTHLSATGAGLLAGVVYSHLRSMRFRPYLPVAPPPSILIDWAVLPNVPLSRRNAIEAALINAATGQPYTAQDILALLATASHWWSLEAAGTFSDIGATIPAVSGGAIAAAKDWIGGVLLTQANSILRPTLSADGATFSGANDSNLNGVFSLTNNVEFTAFAVARPITNKGGAFLKTGSESAGWATGIGGGNFDSAAFGLVAELGGVAWVAGWNNLPSHAMAVSGFQRSAGANYQHINGSRVWSNAGAMQPVGSFTAIGGYGTRCSNSEISSAIAFQSALTALQIHQINRFLIAYYNPTADIDAVIYSAAANATPAQYDAIDTFAKALKSNGTWAKYQAIYPLFGDSSGWRNSQLNLKRSLQDASAYQISWVGNVAYAANGVSSLGNSYGNTNYRGAIKHASIWTHGTESNALHSYGRIRLAANGNPAEWSTLQVRDSSNLAQAWAQSGVSINGAVPAGVDPGLLSVTADLGQPTRLYRNGVILTTASSPLVVTPSNPIDADCLLLAANLGDAVGNSAPYAYSNRRTSYFAVSDQHFTGSEIAADYAAVSILQTALGR